MSAHLKCCSSSLEERPTPVETPTLGHQGPSGWKYPKDWYPLAHSLHHQIQEGELTLSGGEEVGHQGKHALWMSHRL